MLLVGHPVSKPTLRGAGMAGTTC